MNELFIILPVVAIISIAFIIYATRNSQEIKEEEPRFQPRKVTDLSKGQLGMDPIEKPKRKKKRYYNKKKPAVANNAPTEKRSVGRPRKTT